MCVCVHTYIIIPLTHSLIHALYYCNLQQNCFRACVCAYMYISLTRSLTQTHVHNRAHTVTLHPAQNTDLTLRGFLIQGRTQFSNDMVGTFADPAPLNKFTQLSICTPRNVGVTHDNPGPAPMRIDDPGPFTFTWTAPAAGTGPIWFHYTIM